MIMMMRRVMCVLAVVLCCACGYTMTAAAAGQPKAVMANTGLPDELKNIVGSEYPSSGEFPYVEKSTEINDYFKKKNNEAKHGMPKVTRQEGPLLSSTRAGAQNHVVSSGGDTSQLPHGETETEVVPDSNAHTRPPLENKSQMPSGPENTVPDTESPVDPTMSQKAEIAKQDGAEGEHEGTVSSSGTSVSLKTEESGPSAEATSSTTVGTHSSEVVDSQHSKSQTPSENTTENSNTNDGNPSQN
ncbi:uncharacterized protein TM35_001221000, partial [Trypanosoma theileri]